MATPAAPDPKSPPTVDPSALSDPLGTVVFHTQSPIFFDIGIGPAYMFDPVRAWSVVSPPGAPTGTPGVVRQTTTQPNFDAMISVSPYIWGPRYAGDSLQWRGCETLLPRPVVGFSAKAIVSALYLGAEWDPVQFLDVSTGVYVYSRPELVSGVSVGDTIAGTTVPTQNLTRASAFVAVTSSLNLFTSWLTSTVKSP
ncbi:MAG TPA: hypothetical protein VHU90_05365, partial [Galbitalea sp.]|nr:hypothetical protein [Galbitalea sp.]